MSISSKVQLLNNSKMANHGDELEADKSSHVASLRRVKSHEDAEMLSSVDPTGDSRLSRVEKQSAVVIQGHSSRVLVTLMV